MKTLAESFNIIILAYRFRSTACLLLGDLFNGALDFGDIHGLVVDLDDAAENGAHLDELVLVACDEVDLCQGHDAGCGRLSCWRGEVVVVVVE